MDAAISGNAGLARVLFDFSRGRQAILSVAQPALGALLALQGIPAGRVLVLGTLAATTGYLSVFSLNDLLDRDVDRLSLERDVLTRSPGESGAAYDLDVAFLRHPLARGYLPLSMAMAWVTGLGVAGLLLAYALRPLCAALFVACVALEILYCSLKRRTWLKTIPAGLMVGLGGLAGWFAVGSATWGAAAFGLLLVVWEIFGRNLSNDLADVSADRPVGIVTVATTYGPAATTRLILAGAVAMPLVAGVQAGGWILRLFLALVAFSSMTAPALRLAFSPTEARAQHYFNRASLFPPLALVAALLLLVR